MVRITMGGVYKSLETDLGYTELVVKFLHKPFSRGGV